MLLRCSFLYLSKIFFLLNWDLLWNHFLTQNVMICIVLPTTHLKRQTNVLRDKMGMEVAPKLKPLKYVLESLDSCFAS